ARRRRDPLAQVRDHHHARAGDWDDDRDDRALRRRLFVRADAPPQARARDGVPMMREAAIDARRVRKVFGKGALAFEALKGVDFHVNSGEFVMLAGPSGSGKTTLLSILGCVLTATSGEVRICDEEVSRLQESELPRIRTECIGFIFQGHNLIASLTAAEN